ncbi:ThiF family adenylyltransferase [Desulfovibrio subterraneus]|uniref:HesA/MoeB/ThiF family protein n=1 Tax=Desulfovibrio subterraneus TaxID=2718620 RepID=UPI0022B90F17|nr:ThiF family adenylyltransferase [Desulfovibrio subterraneus]WBF66043.1 ThiF family adenylyltransferase [Desulfovibrio subterraneus]
MNQYNEEHFRLRPSVSFVPLPKEGHYQFFLSDIRQSFTMAFADTTYVTILSNLDGSLAFRQLKERYSLSGQQMAGLERLLQILIKQCVVEDIRVVASREKDSFRRVKNFIASYVPYHDVEAAWGRIADSHAVVIGAGGVGSWVVSLLAQIGVRAFTLLDDDVVKPHNLNRSLFTKADVGSLKTLALTKQISSRREGNYSVTSITEKLERPERLVALLRGRRRSQAVLVNCADFPSVSHTSAIINEAAFVLGLPYIIAGGYNMHLSLVGPTIIPGKTPCFRCIAHAMDTLKVAEIEGAERIVKEHRNLGNLAPLAAISASFVANEYLKLVLGLPNLKPTMIGKRGEFNFITKKLVLEEYEMWNECPFCCRGGAK